jgi:exopolysaccharide biosynthesis polyprenyl glycosylphosphotransferase
MAECTTRSANGFEAGPLVGGAPGAFGSHEPPALTSAGVQRRSHVRNVAELHRAIDVVVALVAVIGVFLLANAHHMPGGLREFLRLRVSPPNVLLLCIFGVLWSQVFSVAGLYDRRRRRTPLGEVLTILAACSVGSVLVVIFPILSDDGAFGFDLIPIVWLTTMAGTLVARPMVRRATRASRARDVRRVLIVGSGPRAFKVYRELRASPDSGCDVVGFVDSNDQILYDEIRERTLGHLDQLAEVIVRHVVDDVLVALPIRSCYVEIQRAIETCERVGVRAKYLADIFQCSLARARYDDVDRLPVVTMDATVDDGRLFLKRAIDIVGASVALALLSPLLLATTIAVIATSPGPVFFVQERYGLRRRRFKMLKFRTMVQNAEGLQSQLEVHNEAAGPVFKIRNDPRTTPIGRFLRRSSIDELPQLINVLQGHMSLVGPRPLPARDVSRFSEPWLMRRFSVTPGMTGAWQVSGRSQLGFDDWIALDLQYIDQWSLALDFKILARTIPAVLKGTGAR